MHWRDMLSRALSKFSNRTVVLEDAIPTLLELPTQRLLAADPILRGHSERYDRYYGMRADLEKATWRLPVEDGMDAVNAYIFFQGCSGSGFRRQRAIEAARDLMLSGTVSPGSVSPSIVALLLIRCDDWVRPVRDAAETALRDVLADHPNGMDSSH
jgi:hypothetical protein